MAVANVSSPHAEVSRSSLDCAGCGENKQNKDAQALLPVAEK